MYHFFFCHRLLLWQKWKCYIYLGNYNKEYNMCNGPSIVLRLLLHNPDQTNHPDWKWDKICCCNGCIKQAFQSLASYRKIYPVAVIANLWLLEGILDSSCTVPTVHINCILLLRKCMQSLYCKIFKIIAPVESTIWLLTSVIYNEHTIWAS